LPRDHPEWWWWDIDRRRTGGEGPQWLTAVHPVSCGNRPQWVVSGPSLRCIGGAPISDPNVRDATESLDLLFARFQFGA